MLRDELMKLKNKPWEWDKDLVSGGLFSQILREGQTAYTTAFIGAVTETEGPIHLSNAKGGSAPRWGLEMISKQKITPENNC